MASPRGNDDGSGDGEEEVVAAAADDRGDDVEEAEERGGDVNEIVDTFESKKIADEEASPLMMTIGSDEAASGTPQYVEERGGVHQEEKEEQPETDESGQNGEDVHGKTSLRPLSPRASEDSKLSQIPPPPPRPPPAPQPLSPLKHGLTAEAPSDGKGSNVVAPPLKGLEPVKEDPVGEVLDRDIANTKLTPVKEDKIGELLERDDETDFKPEPVVPLRREEEEEMDEDDYIYPYVEGEEKKFSAENDTEVRTDASGETEEDLAIIEDQFMTKTPILVNDDTVNRINDIDLEIQSRHGSRQGSRHASFHLSLRKTNSFGESFHEKSESDALGRDSSSDVRNVGRASENDVKQESEAVPDEKDARKVAGKIDIDLEKTNMIEVRDKGVRKRARSSSRKSQREETVNREKLEERLFREVFQEDFTEKFGSAGVVFKLPREENDATPRQSVIPTSKSGKRFGLGVVELDRSLSSMIRASQSRRELFDESEEPIKVDDRRGASRYAIVAERRLIWQVDAFRISISSAVIGIFLILLGIVGGCTEYFVDYTVRQIVNFRSEILKYSDELSSDILRTLSQIGIYTLFMSILVAVGMILTLYRPRAAGSGIPEMRFILQSWYATADSKAYLGDFQLFIVKVLGLVCAVGSGLAVGREGPFVHISCIVAQQLMNKLVVFRKYIGDSEALRRQALLAACAVGVASTFRSPLGGVLFSIEVVTTYYFVSNYWKGVLAATSSFVVAKFLELWEFNGDQDDAIAPLFFYEQDISTFRFPDIPFYLLIGVVCGLIGIFYKKAYMALKRFFYKRKGNRTVTFLTTLLVVLATGFAFAPLGPFSRDYILFNAESLLREETLDPAYWGDTVLLSLSLFLVSRLLLTVVSVNLQIPCGDFIPLFSTGAAAGRLIAETMKVAFPTTTVSARGFALCGAASLLSAVTHTFSPAIIVIELTWQLQYLIPLLLSVLLAYYIADKYSPSIYESRLALIVKQLEYIPRIRHQTRLLNQKAFEIMERQNVYFTSEVTVENAIRILKHSKKSVFPLVKSTAYPLFLGTVDRYDVLAHLYELMFDYMYEDFLVEELPDDFEDLEEVTKDKSPWFIRIANEAAEIIRRKRESSKAEKTVPLKIREKDRYKKFKSLGTRMIAFGEEGSIPVNHSAIQINPEMRFGNIHVLIEMLRASRLFVTQNGILLGLITPRELIRSINKDRVNAMKTMGEPRRRFFRKRRQQ